MRRYCFRCGKKAGLACMVLGAIIILALIMPPVFWCFSIGAALICVGAALIRR